MNHSALAVDATNLLHRAYHAMAGTDMRLADGTPLWALHGLAGLIAKHVESLSPQWMVLAFDMPGSSARRKALDPGYKAGRKEGHADLVAQLDAAPRLLQAAGFSVLASAEVEADDTLAAVASASARVSVHCHLLTSDRDALTHIGPGCTVVLPGGEQLDVEHVLHKYGVTPGRYREMAALVGESSDNLAGVPGIGPKTAAKILNDCRHVTDLLDDPALALQVAGPRYGKLLVEHAQRVRINLEMTQPHQVEVIESLKAGGLPMDAARIRDAFAAAGLPAAGTRLARACG